jgi:hypothetical protein
MQVECVEDGILYVFVSNEACAAEIETNHSDDLAAAAETGFQPTDPNCERVADGLFQPAKKRRVDLLLRHLSQMT